MATVIDYSAAVPSAASVKGAGHVGAVRYISPPREAWMLGKPMHRAERDDFIAHGLKLAVCWQYGKEKHPDVMRGFDGGVADAHAAQERLNRLGLADLPVFFAVDFDIDLDQWNGTAVEYFRGAGSVLGKQRVGIYGHSRVIAWAAEDDVVAIVEQGRVLGWQTKSWSDGVIARDYAVLYQGVHNVPGPDGVQIDVNEVLHPEWGWRALPGDENKGVEYVEEPIRPHYGRKGDPHWLPDVLRAFGVEVEEMPGWDQWGVGDFEEITHVIAHHTAGANTPAEYIAFNPGIGNGLSSQIHLARDGVATMCGVGIAWHAGEAVQPPELTGYVDRVTNGVRKPFTKANAVSIGIEAVNAGDGSQPWPDEQMDAYYRICAAICWYLGLPVENVLGHKEIAPRRKIDPNFDMDEFRRNVKEYIDYPPFVGEIKGEIAAMAADLNTVLTALDGTQHKAKDLIAYTDGRVFEIYSEHLPRLEDKVDCLDSKVDRVIELLEAKEVA